MSNNRPFARLGIAELEEMFDKQSGDLTIIARIKNELSHRRVPRALALQEKILKIELSSAKPSTPVRLEPLNKKPAEKIQAPSVVANQSVFLDSVPVFSESPTKVSSTSSMLPILDELVPLPQLALEDAFKILKVSAGDAWDKIEIARRNIVQKSNPIANRGMAVDQVEKFLSNAKLANDAAIVIAARRSNRK